MLVQELRHEALQPLALPLILAILSSGQVPGPHFCSVLLPPLAPVLEGARGELLAALVSAGPVLARLMGG